MCGEPLLAVRARNVILKDLHRAPSDAHQETRKPKREVLDSSKEAARLQKLNVYSTHDNTAGACPSQHDDCSAYTKAAGGSPSDTCEMMIAVST